MRGVRDRFPGWLQTALVSLLVLVTGALVGYALHESRRPPPGASLSATSADPAANPASSAGPVASLVAPNSPTPVPRVVAVSAYSPSDALRALSAARCPSSVAPVLQLTTDGGRSWTTLVSPAASVLRVRLTTPGVAWLVGRSATCVAGYYSTGTAGATWSAASSTAGVWYLLPGTTVVHLPAGGTATPCPVGDGAAALSPVSGTVAAVACTGPTGLTRELTADGGASWTPAPAPAVTTVLGQDSLGTSWLLAGTGTPGCAGTSLWHETTATTAWTQVACLPAAGAAALAFSTPTDALGVLDQTLGGLVSYATSDGGLTWNRV